MLIVNADDWGRSRAETDTALACFSAGRVTSVSAMVFMDDSERAAGIAKDAGVDTGLHLNLSERWTTHPTSGRTSDDHERVNRFLRRSRYAQLVYNPVLRGAFRAVYQAQIDEFVRLYAKRPSHVDGHQHMHLCGNMLWDAIIPQGERVRRSFSFQPGEKSFLNRAYRRLVDRRLAQRHRSTDYFFALAQHLSEERLRRVLHLAREANVELETHPVNADENNLLMSEAFAAGTRGLDLNTYAAI